MDATPARYWKRKDESLGISFGNPLEGYHEQFDFHGSEELATFIVKVVNERSALLEALKAAKEVVDVAEGMTACRSDDDFVWSAQKLATAAIAKSEGRS
jgi:hypothetical protein